MKLSLDLIKKIEEFRAIQNIREEKLRELESAKAELDLKLPPLKEAILLARKCLEESLEQKKYIEDIVSNGLTEVFGIKYTFILETVYGEDGAIKGLKPRLQEEGGELDDPSQSFGAGAQSIASVCFRIAILLLSSGTAKILILDEPLANVSPALQDRFKLFIEHICKETGLQLIMVTHMDQPFGKVYRIEKVGKRNRRISTAEVINDAYTL